jgi:hypothetical protein
MLSNRTDNIFIRLLETAHTVAIFVAFAHTFNLWLVSRHLQMSKRNAILQSKGADNLLNGVMAK